MAVARSPEYKTWAAMKSRCCDPSNSSYFNYGGRGITVCLRWHKFENFLADMGKRPVGTSIDRIDNNEGYDLANCRWATTQQQQRNRRDNFRIAYQGETLTITEWGERTGISMITLRGRLRRGWSIEDAFTVPANMSASIARSHKQRRLKRTHCKYGHSLNPETTRIIKANTLVCKICEKAKLDKFHKQRNLKSKES